MKKLTIEEIKHIAELAKLKFNDEELNKFESEFNNILDNVSLIQECDTTGIEFEHNLVDYIGETLQEDIVKPGLTNEEAMLNATENRNKAGFIVTSKIVSKE